MFHLWVESEGIYQVFNVPDPWEKDRWGGASHLELPVLTAHFHVYILSMFTLLTAQNNKYQPNSTVFCLHWLLHCITRIASKIIGLPTPTLADMNNKAITRLALSITNDTDHPLYRYFDLMPSGRRYRTLKWQKVGFSRSFVPSAIAALYQLPRP